MTLDYILEVMKTHNNDLSREVKKVNRHNCILEIAAIVDSLLIITLVKELYFQEKEIDELKNKRKPATYYHIDKEEER